MRTLGVEPIRRLLGCLMIFVLMLVTGSSGAPRTTSAFSMGSKTVTRHRLIFPPPTPMLSIIQSYIFSLLLCETQRRRI
ncbi:hypothetical protein B0H16DRAFT_1544650 [Mycena metata]|uniref:Secreted protein n=1 Tax=Mycena metata TaxID=1033252 RepID=A0AAD7J1H8_9AGAR|nr:hypothetical protein B0H16DRAFT_1544650 [Mycena metata]